MKVKVLKSRLTRAGFVRLRKRGKGSHSVWVHNQCQIKIINSGKDNSDAKPYQLKTIRLALQKVQKVQRY